MLCVPCVVCQFLEYGRNEPNCWPVRQCGREEEVSIFFACVWVHPCATNLRLGSLGCLLVELCSLTSRGPELIDTTHPHTQYHPCLDSRLAHCVV